jgi:hypothetical protein
MILAQPRTLNEEIDEKRQLLRMKVETRKRGETDDETHQTKSDSKEK